MAESEKLDIRKISKYPENLTLVQNNITNIISKFLFISKPLSEVNLFTSIISKVQFT